MADFKGNVNDDLEDAFSALLVNNKGDDNNKEEPIDSLAPSFFTSFFFTLVESLLTKPAIAYIGSPYIKVLIKELNN